MVFENMSVDSIVGDRLKSSITKLINSDKETGFLPSLRVTTKYFGKNPVSGLRA